MASIDVDAIRDDFDLAVALTLALRNAKQAGDVPWQLELHATLDQVVHQLGLPLPESERRPAAITRLNGSLEPTYLRRLLRA